MNLNKTLVVSAMLITGIFVAAAGSYAGKPVKCSPWPECQDDSDPPPPPPPSECNDPSPSFIYLKPGWNNTDETYLSSADGCIQNPLPGVGVDDRWKMTVHMTDILLGYPVYGVIIWIENQDGTTQAQMRRADFTENSAGDLTQLVVDTDPLDQGDPAVPEGHI
jgi:hypothetical protein